MLSPSQPYRAFGDYLKERFGQKVTKIALDAGLSCPNRDGTLSRGGCIFCQPRSFSPPGGAERKLTAQLAAGIAAGRRRGISAFIAYFQAYTNTYAPVARLRKIWDTVRASPEIKALAVGTRPDCVSEPVLELLAGYARDYEIWLELGLQTVHDRTLKILHRGHSADDFFQAVARARRQTGLQICAHVILGLPGESEEDELATADALAALKLEGVKLHPLYIAGNTQLAAEHARHEIPLLTQSVFAYRAVNFIERLWPGTVIQRLTADCPAEWLKAPSWLADKPGVLRAIREEFVRRQTWQGKHFSGKLRTTPPFRLKNA
jgi:uncharacterized protein